MKYGLSLPPGALRAARPPVLLLGGLNIARALGLAGIPVVVASPEPDAAAFASRYCSGRLRLPPLESREAVLELLLGAGERLAAACGGPLPLFYGNDDYLDLVQRHREALGARFRLLLNAPYVADALIDKERFDAFAAEQALPVPRRLEWKALADFTGALVVKPKSRMAWDDSPVYRRLLGGAGKARVFASGRDAAAHPVVAQLKSELAFQEYLPGDDRSLWSFHGFADEEGRLLAWFIGRKLRTYPALTGFSSFLELAYDGDLFALGRDIVRRLPLRGVFKLDFKRDADSRSFRLLEINARFNLWHYVAARNGINLPAVAYDYLIAGKRPEYVLYRTTWRWLSLAHDWRAYRELAARGELGAARWIWSLLRAPKVYDLFSWSDPRPFVQHWMRKLARLPRLTLRLWRWLSTAS
jgi:D-aspartate ligase